MWIVTQDYIRGELVYLVEHTITGERRGMFDWQARAQEFADELNEEAAMQIAKKIVHNAIDNTTWAEEAYPGIKERLHKAVDEFEEETDG